MKNLLWLIPAVVLLLFFIFRMFRAPYHFYSKQQEELKVLKGQLSQLGFEIQIGGMIIIGVDGDSTRLQLTTTVINRGNPATAHEWKLSIITPTRELDALYMPGARPVEGSPDVPPLDDSLRGPLGTNNEIPGLLNFLLPKIPQAIVEQLIHDPQAKLVLSVLDNTNRKWTGERNIAEMAAEKFVRYPSK